MQHSFSFHTSDVKMAEAITTLLSGGLHAAAPSASPAPTVVVPAANPPAALSMVAPAAPVAPVAPATPPAALTPPTPATPPAAAAPTGLDELDQATLAAGWTVEHVKNAATAYTQKLGAAGPSGMKAILAQHGAEKVVGKNALAPKHYPAVCAALQAA